MKKLNQLGKLALIATMATTTIPAHAVWYGNDVPQEEAADFRVFVSASGGNCGGQVIAGQYVITASHCVMSTDVEFRDFILAREGITEAPERIDDRALLESVLTRDEFASDIYFGSNMQFGGERIEVSETIINPYWVWGYRYGAYADKRNQIENDFGDDYGFTLGGDLVIFKLSETVQQETAAILDVGDIVSPQDKLASLAGWGKNEDGYTENKLHEGLLSLQALPFNLGDPEGMKRGGNDVNPIVDSMYDYPKLSRVDDGNGNLQQSDGGDSGSPVMLDNFTLGFVSGGTVTDGDQYGTGITGPAYWIKTEPWIARPIDAVNTVGKVVLTIDADFNNHEWVIPVQSLKLDDVEVNSTVNLLNNSVNGFTVNSDCSPVLQTGDYCHITLTYNGRDVNGELILQEGDIAANLLIINDSLQIPVAVIYPTKPIEPVIPPTQPSDEKSGGSFGVFGSLILFIELLRRRLIVT